MPEQNFKRHIAYKTRIGDLLSGNVIMEMDRIKCVEVGQKQLVRVNVIANIVDKFVQDGEKKFGSITLDDASGQLKVKVFGDDLAKFTDFAQGDTVLVIGLIRAWNNEVYLTPDIIKKKEPAFLLVRKLEIEKERPKTLEKTELAKLRDEIISSVKKNDENGGVDIESMILELKATPHVINEEIKRLLEEGMVYEPRPGKLRYLGE